MIVTQGYGSGLIVTQGYGSSVTAAVGRVITFAVAVRDTIFDIVERIVRFIPDRTTTFKTGRH